MSVRFTAPVARELAAQVRLASGRRRAARAGVRQGRQGERGDRDRVSQAARRERRLQRSRCRRRCSDNAGRPLANASAFPLKVQTGSAPPIAKFAAAPFGIIERNADAMLPVTLRHVQAELPARAAARPRARRPRQRGQVRVKRLQSDADILAWYARLQKYHETQMTARGARPARARLVHRSRKRRTPRDAPSSAASTSTIGTREVSLLAKEAGARAARRCRSSPAATRGRSRSSASRSPSRATTSSRSSRCASASRCSTSARRCSSAPACSSPTSASTSSTGARTASSG